MLYTSIYKIFFNVSANACKARWNNIRDNYRKSLKKIKTGQVSGPAKHYKYSDLLFFLNKYLQEREKVITTVYESVKIEENPHYSEEEIPLNENHDSIVQENNSENIIKIEEPDEEQDDWVEHKKRSTLQPRRGIKRKYKLLKTANANLKKYFLEKSSNEQNVFNQLDPVDAFLAGLAPTLKSLSPYYLNLAKSKIFSIVQEFELRMLVENGEEPIHEFVPVPFTAVESCETSITPAPS